MIRATFRIACSFARLGRRLLGCRFRRVVQDQAPAWSSKVVDVVDRLLDLVLDLGIRRNRGYSKHDLWVRAFLLGAVYHRLSLDRAVLQLSV